MIGIVDYGLGNLRSIQNMLGRSGFKSVISDQPQTLAACERLILPGVGHFRYAMEQLRARGLVEFLTEQALDEKKPVLGICLGAQLLGRHSCEGDADGLGWIDMDIVPFDRDRLTTTDKVPHMGWADTACRQHPLFEGLEDPRFYYVHSFHFACDVEDDVLCEATHGYEFASGVARGAILGVQFHPEKSHVFGRRLLKNWAEMSFAPA